MSPIIGKAQHPLGVMSPANLHLTISPSSSPLGHSGYPSHKLSRNIGRVNPILSGDKQLVTGFLGLSNSDLMATLINQMSDLNFESSP